MSVILLDNRRKKEVIMEIMPHLQIRDDLGVHYAILPGDPARVDRIAEQLTDVEELAYSSRVSADFIKVFLCWQCPRELADRLPV